MPFSLIPTPVLEWMLDNSNNQEAIDEYNRLREIHCHLATHLIAVKQQTDSTVAGIQASAPSLSTRKMLPATLATLPLSDDWLAACLAGASCLI